MDGRIPQLILHAPILFHLKNYIGWKWIKYTIESWERPIVGEVRPARMLVLAGFSNNVTSNLLGQVVI